MPCLPPQEFEQLKDSIKQHGQLYPIIVNRQGVILDGHNRYRACNELAKEIKYEIKDFEDPLLEKKFVIEVNLRRRHLTDFQRAELGMELLAIEREEAKRRQGTRTDLTSCSNEHEVDFGKARNKVAKRIQLSPTTFQRAMKIMEEAPEEVKQKLRENKLEITTAYHMLRKEERIKHTPKLPEGKFDLIYADPAWHYGGVGKRGSAQNHYNTMTTEEICSLKPPCADNAVLFLWSTMLKLPDALRVIEAWGFTYNGGFCWVKHNIGTGYYVRYRHELLLLGFKGNMPTPLERDRHDSVIEAPATKHSEKPEIVYDIIEKMYPNKTYLELFARKERKGWTSWGDELS